MGRSGHGATKGSPPAAQLSEGEIEREQALLSFLAEHHRKTLSSAEFETVLQRIKSFFYDRKYDSVFLEHTASTLDASHRSDETLQQLKVYSARFVPSRALIYRRLILDMAALAPIRELLRKGGSVVSIGGGAGSEWLAFRLAREVLSAKDTVGDFRLEIFDYAQWSSCLDNLAKDYMQHQKSAKDLSSFVWQFRQSNVLEERLHASFAQAQLITILFTLNELFTQSKAKTMLFLKNLVSSMQVGCLLLVVESSGSFSTLNINGNQYAVSRLLDGLRGFTALASEDSHWSRLSKGLKYPLPLEDSRHFVRLYQRIED